MDRAEKYKMNCFAIKKKLVLEGKSKIFTEWQELVPSLTAEKFIENLEWVCADPCENGDGTGRLTREIGLTTAGIVQLSRINSEITVFCRNDTKERWDGDTFRVPCIEKFIRNAEAAIKMGYADKDGMCEVSYKIGLSCRDRV